MPNPVTVNFSFAVYPLSEWIVSDVPLTTGFLAIVEDEHNAFKIGDGVSSFAELPYQGSTLLQVTYATVDLTRVYPKSFVILETDTSRLRIPDGVTQYADLPTIDTKRQFVHPSLLTSKIPVTSAESSAIKTIIDDISTVSISGRTNAVISASTIDTAFTNQSLDATDYSILTAVTNGTTTDYSVDHTQLLLLMIDNINKRLTHLETQLL